eukprot:7357266-Prymnesium_polylepis.2
MSGHIQAVSIDKSGQIRTDPQTYPDMDMSSRRISGRSTCTSTHKSAINIVQRAERVRVVLEPPVDAEQLPQLEAHERLDLGGRSRCACRRRRR